MMTGALRQTILLLVTLLVSMVYLLSSWLKVGLHPSTAAADSRLRPLPCASVPPRASFVLFSRFWSNPPDTGLLRGLLAATVFRPSLSVSLTLRHGTPPCLGTTPRAGPRFLHPPPTQRLLPTSVSLTLRQSTNICHQPCPVFVPPFPLPRAARHQLRAAVAVAQAAP